MRRSTLVFFVIVLLFLQPAVAVFAAPSGAAQPTAGTVPGSLTIESCSIVNGDSDIPVNPTVQVNFSKNVVNIAVMFENSNRFHISDSKGATVPICVIFPDDQLQSAFTSQVFIMPQQPLDPNSTYSLVIDNTLEAKNGERIDDAHVLTFSTSDSLTDEMNPILAKLGDNIMSFDVALKLSEASVPAALPVNAPKPETGSAPDLSGAALALFIIQVAAIILIAALLFHKKRKAQNSV